MSNYEETPKIIVFVVDGRSICAICEVRNLGERYVVRSRNGCRLKMTINIFDQKVCILLPIPELVVITKKHLPSDETHKLRVLCHSRITLNRVIGSSKTRLPVAPLIRIS